MPAAQRSKMVTRANRNRRVRRLAGLWRLLATLLEDYGPVRSGCIEIEDHREGNGVTVNGGAKLVHRCNRHHDGFL